MGMYVGSQAKPGYLASGRGDHPEVKGLKHTKTT